MNDPVRNTLERFGGWWGASKGWRKVGIGSLITFLTILSIFLSLVTLLVWLVKGLTVGGARNKDLYIPKMGRR